MSVFWLLMLAGSDGTSEQEQKIVEWLADGGATVHSSLLLRRSRTLGARGLHTAAPLAPGTELAAIPRRLWLDDANTAQSHVGPLLSKIKSQAKRLPKPSALAILMVHEKLQGAASFWGPYIEHLPSAYPELPLYWSQHLRRVILSAIPQGMGTWLHTVHLDYAEKEFALLKQVVFEPHPELFPQTKTYTLYDAYAWAYCTILSRAHSMGDMLALIPWADSTNHNSSAAGAVGDLGLVPLPKDAAVESAEAMQLLSNRAYNTGEEVFVAYDNLTKCHAHMLALYGFTDAHEISRDCFHLELDDAAVNWGARSTVENTQQQHAEETGRQATDEDYRLNLLAAHGLQRQPGDFSWTLQKQQLRTILVAEVLPTIRAMLLPPSMEGAVNHLQPGREINLRRPMKGVDEVLVWRTLRAAVLASAELYALDVTTRTSAGAAGAAEAGEHSAFDETADEEKAVTLGWLGYALQLSVPAVLYALQIRP